MNSVLILGCIIFLISSIYFWFANKKSFNSAFLVSLITLVSYIIMLEGRFVIGTVDEGVYWTRWLIYGISCALLTYEISKQLNLPSNKAWMATALTPVVMVTGTLSAIYSGVNKWYMFGISTLAFFIIGWIYFSSQSKELNRIKLYFLLGWSVFPVVFLFSPEGLGGISVVLASSIYLILDIFTKTVFYIHYQSLKQKVN
jgi:sensory rhodopsin